MSSDASHPLDNAGTLPPAAAFTASPAATPSQQTGGAARPDLPGYEIEGELGRGGMGVVYKARQTRLGRAVALKMILSGAHAGDADLDRFRTEAEAIARLQHPNIVQVFEVGEHGGLPFFSLEFCPGGSLDGKLAGTPLPPEEAAALVEALARAMQAAHDRGVIHRDLKPANVLLADDGTPKVTDFGLAKKLDEAGRTATGAVMGTPSYMAPEQAGGKAVGPLADVYALGAILYECLTGRPPFKAATPLDTVLQVVSDEPVAPRRLNPKVPRDLETVCLKCLEKEPRRRYASAAGLADDLRRFRAGEPVAARPAGRPERAWRWCRRNPAVAALLTTVALVLVAGTVVSTYFALEARDRAEDAEKSAHLLLSEQREREKARNDALESAKQANAARTAAERAGYFNGIALAHQLYQGNSVARARQVLAACPKEFRNWEWRYLNRLCHSEQHSFPPVPGSIEHLAYSPDGKLLAAAGEPPQGGGNGVFLWDTATGKPVWQSELSGTPGLFAFSPDGKSGAWNGGGKILVGDLPTEKDTAYRVTLQGKTVACLAYTPDGKLLAAAFERKGNSNVSGPTVYDAHTGEALMELPGFDEPRGAILTLAGAAFSPDGKRLAALALARFGHASGDAKPFTGRVRVWDLKTREIERSFDGVEANTTTLAVSPDGNLVAWGHHNSVAVADLNSKGPPRLLAGHQGEVHAVAFSTDRKLLASGGGDMTVRLWDVASGQEVMALRGHDAAVEQLAFRPDGKQLASSTGGRAARGGQVKLWDVTRAPEALTLQGPAATFSVCFALSADAACCALLTGKFYDPGDERAKVEIGDLTTGVPARRAAAAEDGLAPLGALSRDGRWLAHLGPRGVLLYDAVEGKQHGAFPLDTEVTMAGAAFAPDGKRLALAWVPDGREEDRQPDGRIRRWSLSLRWWEVPTGKGGRSFRVTLSEADAYDVTAAAFDADGRRVAVTVNRPNGQARRDYLGAVWLIDTADGSVVQTFKADYGLYGVALSPDGKRLVAAGGSAGDGRVTVWDIADGKEVASLRGHAQTVYGVDFSPDGRRIATGSADRTVKLWEPGGAEVLTLHGHRRPVTAVAFSGDGRRLVSGTGLDLVAFFGSGTVPTFYRIPAEFRVWDARP